MGDDWHENPENLTIKNLGAAVYSINNQGESFCSDEGDGLTAGSTSGQISKLFHREHSNDLNNKIFTHKKKLFLMIADAKNTTLKLVILTLENYT